MTKFGSAFMMKSPFKKHGEEFIKKAKELSKESGTPGDFDRDNPEVVKQLEKAKQAEAEHKGSPAEMKSPLHAPVTATQELTSDMYYQPREEIDYENMVESFGKMGAAGRNFFGGKKKTDPVDDLSNKIQSQQKSDAQKKVEEENKIRETSKVKYNPETKTWIRVDKTTGETIDMSKYTDMYGTPSSNKENNNKDFNLSSGIEGLNQFKNKPLFKGK